MMRMRKKRVMLIADAVIMLILLALDQLAKHLAIVHLKNSPAI